MEVMANALTVLTTIALGLSAGALVTEGAVLIPSWRSLQPDRFLAWYREHARLLFKFFGPLEIVAAGLVNTPHPPRRRVGPAGSTGGTLRLAA